MSNQEPNLSTRFVPGISGNPKGRPKGLKDRATILKGTKSVRTLEELRGDPNAWKGSSFELFEAVMRDPVQPLDLRLHCGAALMRHAEESGTPSMTSVV